MEVVRAEVRGLMETVDCVSKCRTEGEGTLAGQGRAGLGFLSPGKAGSPERSQGLISVLLVPAVPVGTRLCPACLSQGAPCSTLLGSMRRKDGFEGISPGNSPLPWLQLAGPGT